jgi:hypothetical protein
VSGWNCLDVFCFDVTLIRSRRAKDEPRCEELRAENNKLTAKMFKTKDVQIAVVQAVEKLKTEKTDLLKRKAGCFCIYLHQILILMDRKVSTMRSR